MSSEKKLNFFQATALIVGNMVGSGIFLLPASLSVYGILSLGGWAISTAGAVCIALIFGRLSKIIQKSGGPYTYTSAAFGAFPGFIVGWGYWMCTWIGNAAIVTALVSNLCTFFPLLQTNNIAGAATAIVIVWSITLLNCSGVKDAAIFQLISTVLKIIPIILIGIVGFFFIKPEHLQLTSTNFSFSDLLSCATLTLWAFLGIEAATIPAKHIAHPEKNISRATITGTLFSAVIFILSCTAVIGIVPPLLMQKSNAPFADAATQIWGINAGYLFAGAAVISCLGALNGWILMQGQMPAAVAADGLFPKFLGTENSRHAPVNALVISSVLVTVLVCFNYTETLQKQFKFMILLSTLSVLIPYAFCSCAEVALKFSRIRIFISSLYRKENTAVTQKEKKDLINLLLLSAASLTFSVAAIIGSGWDIILKGMILIAAGIPVYFFSRKRLNS